MNIHQTPRNNCYTIGTGKHLKINTYLDINLKLDLVAMATKQIFRLNIVIKLLDIIMSLYINVLA